MVCRSCVAPCIPTAVIVTWLFPFVLRLSESVSVDPFSEQRDESIVSKS